MLASNQYACFMLTFSVVLAKNDITFFLQVNAYSWSLLFLILK